MTTALVSAFGLLAVGFAAGVYVGLLLASGRLESARAQRDSRADELAETRVELGREVARLRGAFARVLGLATDGRCSGTQYPESLYEQLIDECHQTHYACGYRAAVRDGGDALAGLLRPGQVAAAGVAEESP